MRKAWWLLFAAGCGVKAPPRWPNVHPKAPVVTCAKGVVHIQALLTESQDPTQLRLQRAVKRLGFIGVSPWSDVAAQSQMPAGEWTDPVAEAGEGVRYRILVGRSSEMWASTAIDVPAWVVPATPVQVTTAWNGSGAEIGWKTLAQTQVAVYRSEAGGNGDWVRVDGDLGVAGEVFVDESVEQGRIYEYAVSAFSAGATGCESAWSESGFVTVPEGNVEAP